MSVGLDPGGFPFKRSKPRFSYRGFVFFNTPHMDVDRFMLDPIYFGKSTSLTMLEAINSFKEWRTIKVKNGTVHGYDRELRNLCLYLGNPPVEKISDTHVMKYLNGIIEMGWSQNSLMPRCIALRKFFEYLSLRGYKVMNHELIPIPRKEYKIPRVATDEAYEALLRTIPKETNDSRHIRNLAIVNLLWDTGARNGEIMALDVEDLDLERMRAVIKTEKSKGRRPIRQIFWHKETNENIKKWLSKRERLAEHMTILEPDALFISIAGDKAGHRFTIKGVGEMLRRYSNLAKIPYQNAHSFRHKMGHDIINQSGSAADVMNILGHATLESSSIYTLMTGNELERRYRLLKAEHRSDKS